jgi:PilZ domain
VNERRVFERTSTSVRVEMSHPSFGTIIGFAKDISDGGAQVQLENQLCPPVGTEVMVRFKKAIGSINNEPVRMRIVHQLRNNIGLMFIKTP